MNGSVWRQRDRWVVGFYWKGKQYKIIKYKGEPMYHKRVAQKCLSVIQGDYESYMAGVGAFRIAKYTGKGFTDVLEFFEDWLKTKEKKKPATIKGYQSYYRCWIRPFFKKHPVMLHEIDLATLDKLLDSLKLTGKGKANVMNCFHAFMVYAWRSRRVPEVPPFPERSDYGIVEPTIKWLPESRQMAIINAIPEVHRPIFLWLKYHYRRPAEACALMWEDWDEINQVFIVRRSISSRKIVGSTKTGTEHIIPCDRRFLDIMRSLQNQLGKFVFKNKMARKSGKRYTGESLNNIWKRACKSVGESIDLYSGLKHSSCSQLVNEKGFALSDVQALTDHARLDSVARYAKVGLSRKRGLMERAAGVIDIADYQQTTSNGK